MKPNNELRVLITGGDGLLGTYLHKCLLDSEINCMSLGRKDLDITSLENIDKVLVRYRPTVIVNCAAYTDVERAETERELCYSVNVEGVKNLILKSNEFNCKLIQISTDFVFDGNKDPGFYHEDDKPNPLNYYGLTKYLAEEEVKNNSINWVIVRTSWLYGKGSKNFVNKIIEFSKIKESITVTDKEFGSPTYALDLSKGIQEIILNHNSGLIHMTNSGYTSRFDFAREIIKHSQETASILFGTNNLNKAIRPTFVVLKSSITSFILRDWKDALKDYLYENH